MAVQHGAATDPGADPGSVELTVGHVIRATRERRKLSARALSLGAGLSDSYVGKVESGTCHVPGDPVLTTRHGWVPMADLDESLHALVTYQVNQDLIRRGGDKRSGYPFTLSSRLYAGDLLSISTAGSVVQVTPNHHFTVRWAPRSLSAWVVYLMRRGTWWRIGMTKFLRSNGSGRGWGLSGRVNEEKGDALWVLGMFDTEREAAFSEKLWSGLFNVPQIGFRDTDARSLFESWDTATGAKGLLDYLNLDATMPIWPRPGLDEVGRGAGTRQHFGGRWLIQATNLIPGFMELPFDPGAGKKPIWSSFTVNSDEWYEGLVYNVNVPTYHHYVAGGGMVVHNCEPSLRAFAKIVTQLGLNAQEVFLILQQEARR